MVIKLPNKRKVREDYDNDKDENEVVIGLEPGHVHNTILHYFTPFLTILYYFILSLTISPLLLLIFKFHIGF